MKWTLEVWYLGAKNSRTVDEAELSDPLTFVEMSDEIRKGFGGTFAGEAAVDYSRPQDWPSGEATEVGCGPWWQGYDKATLVHCNSLLARGERGALVAHAVDGVLDLDAAFDTDGVNSVYLDDLDQAEWKLTPLPDQPDAA